MEFSRKDCFNLKTVFLGIYIMCIHIEWKFIGNYNYYIGR